MISIVRTWSGPERPHWALQLVTARWFVHVWLHSLERGWWCAYPGMLCFGCGWVSVNAFTHKEHA
ncbi:hypothetical protein BH11GEM2_BH11GEM2_40800 [soil metagenome]|jgi:hypothetical protein